MGEITIRSAEEKDLERVAEINAKVFLGNRDDSGAALRWVQCSFRAYPKDQFFVACDGPLIVGYIKWSIHGGFRRPAPAIELVELAIDPTHQGRGVGPRLTKDGLKALYDWSCANNRRIESHMSFFVWCYTENLNAMKIYLETFGDPCGFRIQHGDRAETQFRKRVPLVLPIRD